MPFSVVIPLDEQDKALAARLQGELPGILAWSVQGCLTWQANSLGEPEEVIAATDSYRTEQDALAEFLAECCTIEPDTYEPQHAFFRLCKLERGQVDYSASFRTRHDGEGF